MKQCPMCGAESESDATQCECGYHFSSSAFTVVPSDPRAPPSLWFSAILVIIGLVVMGCAAWVYDPSVETTGMEGLPERIINSGRLQQQTMLYLAGCASFTAGLIGAIITIAARSIVTNLRTDL